MEEAIKQCWHQDKPHMLLNNEGIDKDRISY